MVDCVAGVYMYMNLCMYYLVCVCVSCIQMIIHTTPSSDSSNYNYDTNWGTNELLDVS